MKSGIFEDYTIDDYLHGRCHIFALALHELFDYKMEFLWDIDYWLEDAEYPSTVLVHAYCVVDHPIQPYKLDGRGFLSNDTLEEDYEVNEASYTSLSKKELMELMDNGTLDKPFKNEISRIKQFILHNHSNYDIFTSI